MGPHVTEGNESMDTYRLALDTGHHINIFLAVGVLLR